MDGRSRKTEAIIFRRYKKLLHIRSVLDEENGTKEAPFGEGIRAALDFMLELGEKDSFTTKNVENVAGHIEFGEGEDLLGILCHVDVVPEGDGWSVDPYAGEIRDGKLIARGVLDDKGPTMAAYYAMKIVKESGLPLSKRVRMIIGTDEESEWRCVDTYFKHEEMPTLGFAPDADFPIIYAEKGLTDFDIRFKEGSVQGGQAELKLVTFQSGLRYNMVPDAAEATIDLDSDPTYLCQSFDEFLKENELEGSYLMDSGRLVFRLKGISSHGMEPRNGRNAGLYLAQFLTTLPLDAEGKRFVSFLSEHLHLKSRGESFGIAFEDDITGPLTMNIGKMKFESGKESVVGVNLRYPVTFNFEEGMKPFHEIMNHIGGEIVVKTHMKPHHVNQEDMLVKTLAKVYEEHTGEKAELLSIGGGTYARSLQSGVAFGPLFPGREDIAHKKDEYMFVDDLLKATAIYAQAIYELAK
ncbi:dipeptidase PepV [Bacillus coahuilensis]|uniref:dipeptidase PepV n=1 Tax=Bacillus coahuilensis TaxID=408580 RepID=UPI000B3388A1